MRLYRVLSVCLLYLVPVEGAEKQLSPALTINTNTTQKPINLYIMQESTNRAIAAPITTNTSESNATANAQAVAIIDNTITIQNLLTAFQNNVSPVADNITTWASTHKLQIAGGCGATVYITLCAMLLQANQYLKPNNILWGHWKRQLSVEELYAYCLDDQKKQKLMHSLINTILHRYFNTAKPTNHIEPLLDFMRSLEHEMKIMQRYIVIASCLQKVHLMKLFPTNAKKIALAKQYRQRLQLIKQLFINSMAQYNIQQLFAPKAPTVA